MSPERSKTRKAGGGSPESNGERTAPQREYESYVADERSGDQAPDVLLDVPVLNVEELNLEVEDLKAHVSVRAEIADLVRVNVGVDAYLGKVKLEIKGVEAQVLLKVRLDRILETLDRALDAINRNPQILDRTLQGAGRTLEGAGDTLEQAAGDVGDATGQVAENMNDVAGQAAGGVDQVAREAGEAAGRASGETSSFADLEIEEEYVDEQGRIVGRARDEAGNVVEEILDDEGNVLDGASDEDVGDQTDENGAVAEMTDAARRKAEELGVDLSGVEGTGSGGRIVVRDAQRAAKI